MRCKVIHDDCGSPYLIRLTIFELFGFSLKLHTIIKSDRERELHDHPWSFITFMLCGGYYEETPVNPKTYKLGNRTKKKWHGPGTLRFIKNPYPHRLDLSKDLPINIIGDPDWIAGFPDVPAVTLVLTLPKKRKWGFYGKDKWIPAQEYVNSREC
jgi:hypothetical protein